MSQNPTPQTGLDGYAETTIQCAVSRLINKFGFPDQDREDLEQDLRVILLEALTDYDPSRAKRSTYIKDCIENRVFNLLRDRRRQRRDPRRLNRIGDDAEAGGDTVAVSSLVDARSGAEQERSGLRIDIAAVISALPQRQQEICALLGEHSPYAISQMLGRSKREVYREVEAIRAAFAAAGLEPAVAAPGKPDAPTV